MENKTDKGFKLGITDSILVVVSLVFLIGMQTFIAPCGPKEDGSWMSCHYAGVMVTGLSAVMLVISIIHLIVKDKRIKLGLSVAILPSAVLAILAPGMLIHLCMMDTMRCHTVTQPGVIVLSIIMIIVVIIDIFKNRK